MSEHEEIRSYPVYEYDQCVTWQDLEMMSKYNKACEKMCTLGMRPKEAAQLHQVHLFVDALLEHLKNGKQPSFYQAWDELLAQLPEDWKEAILKEVD